MKKHQTQFSIVVGVFNAKVGNKNVGEITTGRFRIVKTGEEINLLDLRTGTDLAMNIFFEEKCLHKTDMETPGK